MTFQICYRKIRVQVEGTRPTRCAACAAQGRIEMHHWKYAYTTEQVRKNPQLALENTIPFCYQCHKLADAIRNLMRDRFRFNQVMVALSYAAIQKRKGELNV